MFVWLKRPYKNILQFDISSKYEYRKLHAFCSYKKFNYKRIYERKECYNFYVARNKLKDLVRAGWQMWSVKRARLESVAEHIFGVQMLAIAMWAEYK